MKATYTSKTPHPCLKGKGCRRREKRRVPGSDTEAEYDATDIRRPWFVRCGCRCVRQHDHEGMCRCDRHEFEVLRKRYHRSAKGQRGLQMTTTGWRSHEEI